LAPYQGHRLEGVPGEVDAAGQEAAEGALMDSEKGAAVGFCLRGFLGALVAALAAHIDHLDLRLGAVLVGRFDQDSEDDVGAAARAPGHD
jgi:hypothetical protein